MARARKASSAGEFVIPEGFELVGDAPAQNPPEKEFAVPDGFEVVGDAPEVPRDDSITGRLKGRLFGEDVPSTPLDIPRTATTIGLGAGGAIAGASAGMAVGSMFGPAAPVTIPLFGAIGGMAAGTAGAAAGFAAPEVAIDAAEFAGFLPEGSRDQYGLTPDEVLYGAENEALLDLATGGGLAVIRSGARAASSLITGSRKDVAEAAARMGVDMMPVVAGDRVIGRGFVTVFGRFPFLGGGRIRSIGTKAEGKFKEATTALADRISPVISASELGEKIFSDAKTLTSETSRMFSARYKDLWKRAEQAGVQVIPRNTMEKADAILSKIAGRKVSFIGGEAPTGEVVKVVENFISEHILPMRAGPLTNKQSFEAMDALVENIDQALASLAPGQKRFAESMFRQLRTAVQKDAIENVRSRLPSALEEGGLDSAKKIAAEMKELDHEFSVVMSQIFETSAAKRFGSVEKRGLRGLGFDKSTRTPVDKLAKIVIQLDSPQAMQELSRLVNPETYRQVVSHVVDNAMSAALRTNGAVGQLDIGVFARQLGLDGTNASRRQAVSAMLNATGSPVTIEMLDDVVKVGKQLEGFDLPDVSTFVARRGILGGVKGAIGAAVPGLALLGGGSFQFGTVIGAAMFVGGSRLFARIISNPDSARALAQVFDKEVAGVVKRAAAVRAIGAGLQEMREDGEIDEAQYSQLIQISMGLFDELDRHFDRAAGKISETLSP